MMISLFIANIITTALSSNCQYFQAPGQYGDGNGPAIPCSVCFKAHGTDEFGQSYTVSYSFDCNTRDTVTVNGYQHSGCHGEPSTGSFKAYTHSSGGICDHVTFRSYLANPNGEEGKSCTKQDQVGYFEFGFVTQCFNSILYPQFSGKLDCSNTDYFTLTGYKTPNCGGDVIGNMTAKIYAGCQKINASNSLIPKNISNKLPFNIPAFSSNETYFEITECGGGWPLWATILIACGVVLCCCGCVGLAGWFCCCKRRKGGLNDTGNNTGYGQIQTYGEK